MNKAVESRTLATKFKEALKGAESCVIEIRTPLGNATGERFHKALVLAGVQTTLIDVVATPSGGVLIETSQKCARIGLSVQTAFRAVGVEAHLLVQSSRHPNLVIIHLSPEPPGAPKAPKKPSG